MIKKFTVSILMTLRSICRQFLQMIGVERDRHKARDILPRELWTLRSKVGYKDLADQYGSDLVVILESPNVDSRLVQSARDNPLKNKIQFV